jgi:hypothetical protein
VGIACGTGQLGQKESIMGLVSHGLALGLGYMLGRPEGRERLAQVGRQAADLRHRPEVVRLQERGKGLVVEQAQVVKQKVRARGKDADDASGADDAGTTATPGGVSSAPVRPRRLRTPSWRPRGFRRTAHFPPSEGTAPPAALGGTTVEEDSKAARLGMPVAAPESPTERS